MGVGSGLGWLLFLLMNFVFDDGFFLDDLFLMMMEKDYKNVSN